VDTAFVDTFFSRPLPTSPERDLEPGGFGIVAGLPPDPTGTAYPAAVRAKAAFHALGAVGRSRADASAL
jgi:hypothetical protein